MFEKQKLRSRLLRTFEHIKFKAKNPKAKLFGNCIVRMTEDNENIIYKFKNIKITENKSNSKHITLFCNNVKQIEINRFFSVILFNESHLIDKLFNLTDDYTNNYTN